MAGNCPSCEHYLKGQSRCGLDTSPHFGYRRIKTSTCHKWQRRRRVKYDGPTFLQWMQEGVKR